MVANFLGVELEFLQVEVTAEVDVRGSMAVDRQVPVGFQSMHCDVRLRAKDGTNPEHLKTLQVAADWPCGSACQQVALYCNENPFHGLIF
jgi:hypothetical protein